MHQSDEAPVERHDDAHSLDEVVFECLESEEPLVELERRLGAKLAELHQARRILERVLADERLHGEGGGEGAEGNGL